MNSKSIISILNMPLGRRSSDPWWDSQDPVAKKRFCIAIVALIAIAIPLTFWAKSEPDRETMNRFLICLIPLVVFSLFGSLAFVCGLSIKGTNKNPPKSTSITLSTPITLSLVLFMALNGVSVSAQTPIDRQITTNSYQSLPLLVQDSLLGPVSRLSSQSLHGDLKSSSTITNKMIIAICLIGAAAIIVEYAILKCVDASRINADPPIDPTPLPVPPGRPPRPRPPPPKNTNTPAPHRFVGPVNMGLPPLIVTQNESGHLVGVAFFSAKGLNSLYSGTNILGVYVEKEYVDPSGDDYDFCETYVIQSASSVGGPWTDEIQADIWQNTNYINGVTYNPRGDLVESVLKNKKDFPKNAKPDILLQSLVDVMQVTSTQSKFFRLKPGAPVWPPTAN